MNFGFDVSTADNNNLAKNSLISDDFDLIITDREMVNTNGFQVIKRGKVINDNSVIMMVTGC